MREELQIAIRENFTFFLRKVHEELSPGKLFIYAPFLDFLAHKLMALHDGDFQRLNINIPPAHGKTTLCSKAFSAWVLGHDPSSQVMAITGAEGLSKDIAFDVRQILRSKWFREVFPTRLRADPIRRFRLRNNKGRRMFLQHDRGKLHRAAGRCNCDGRRDRFR